jgi:hypothetical protein
MPATWKLVASPATALALLMLGAKTSVAQVDYRNTDSGRPVRIGDAMPTARRSLELNFGNGRVDKLSLGRYRLQLEPRLAYGILPRTEIALRAPIFANERAARPRQGIGGVGLSAEHQLALESMHVPALALAGELFVPTGPQAVSAMYSVKGLLTRTFPAGRLHLNASFGNFKVRAPVGFEKIIPPIHLPCNMIPMDSDIPSRLLCMPAIETGGTAQAATGATITHNRWLAGAAMDKSFPLHSIMLVGDVFAQQYLGIGRPADWTAELGIRGQLTRTVVWDAAIGRLFTGESRASFFTVGTTLSRPLKL